MSAVLCRKDRGPFASPSLELAATASDDARLRAFDGYTSYAGRYAIEGDEVAHTVECSLVPTLVGTTLRRRARLEGGVLTLRYDVAGRKRAYAYELRWSRP